jgi:glycine betaine/choline ABC-type transport system substrate-binding protein
MDMALMYRALATGQVDVIAGDATSALIRSLDLAMLDDDRRYFPPYDAVPVARSASLLERPAMRAALESLAGQVSADDMRALNHAVDVEKRDVAVVVREFRALRSAT